MTYSDGGGDGQTPYVNEYELKAHLAVSKKLYQEPAKTDPIITTTTLNS